MPKEHGRWAAFQCRVCLRSYSKREHLRRHERTHTGERPFSCAVCARCFSRNDSLARHERLHLADHVLQLQSEDASEPPAPPVPIDPAVGPTSEGHPDASEDIGTDIDYGMTFPDLGLTSVLEWPDSEDLLQTIVSTDWNLLALPPASLTNNTQTQNHAQLDGLNPSHAFETSGRLLKELQSGDETGECAPPEGTRQAIQSLSDMVTNFSQGVTATVEALPELTSGFLDNCLQAYFTRFNACFPILHRPTFIFRDNSPSLILNAIAIGSLYIGTSDAIAKGEALWQLAHTAVATSWQALILYRGPVESHNGTQLILTALLGQCYAMMSKNLSLRLTSKVFHNLGFQWASHCDMFACEPLHYHTMIDQAEGMHHRWSIWASSEVKRRALLGHYILDGCINYLSWHGNGLKHAGNPLTLSSPPENFQTARLAEWTESPRPNDGAKLSFQAFYKILFTNSEPLIDVKVALDVRVILECLHGLAKSNVETAQEAVDSIITVPSQDRVRLALMRIYDPLCHTWPLEQTERLELTLYWHFVCIESFCDTLSIASQICRHFHISQHIFQERGRHSDLQTSIRWARESADARRVILHALAAHDIVGQLPLNHSHSFWMPIPVFAVSIMLNLFRLADIISVFSPRSVNWWSTIEQPAGHSGGDEDQSAGRRATRAFLDSNLETPNPAIGQMRNVSQDAERLQTLLHGSAIQWGLSQEMYSVLSQIKSREFVT